MSECSEGWQSRSGSSMRTGRESWMMGDTVSPSSEGEPGSAVAKARKHDYNQYVGNVAAYFYTDLLGPQRGRRVPHDDGDKGVAAPAPEQQSRSRRTRRAAESRIECGPRRL